MEQVKIHREHADGAKAFGWGYQQKSEVGMDSEFANPMDMVKAGGWHSIPGGKHGGERRRKGKGWEYRYPDAIGHTSSGKPIYASHSSGDHFHERHAKYSKTDHRESAEAHRKQAMEHDRKHKEMRESAKRYAGAPGLQADLERGADHHYHEARRHYSISHAHDAFSKKGAMRGSGAKGARSSAAAAINAGNERYEYASKQRASAQKSVDGNPDLVKGDGEGSRGGHIIGHTGSGKPIYAGKHENGKSFHESHKHFTQADHNSAFVAHLAASRKARDKAGDLRTAVFSAASKGDDKGLNEARTAESHAQQSARYHDLMSSAHDASRLSKMGKEDGVHDFAARQASKAGALAESAVDFHGGAAAHDRPEVKKAQLPDVRKGGEGSRGGHIIGHTASGKPVYAGKHDSHANFKKKHANYTRQDHHDAAMIHSRAAAKITMKAGGRPSASPKHASAYHSHMSSAHFDARNNRENSNRAAMAAQKHTHAALHAHITEVAKKSTIPDVRVGSVRYRQADYQAPDRPAASVRSLRGVHASEDIVTIAEDRPTGPARIGPSGRMINADSGLFTRRKE